MTIPDFSPGKLDAEYQIEHGRLFDNILRILSINRNVILLADQTRGLKEYIHELGFQLTEKNQVIRICYMDMNPVLSAGSFLELYVTALAHQFPEVLSRMEIDACSMNTLKLPALIAKKERIRVAVFLANAHQFHRFKDGRHFLTALKLRLKNQKNCVFCLYGKNTSYFSDLVYYPGPLSGLGQVHVLRHNPLNQRSAIIRKFFHDHHKTIEYKTSLHMSYILDNHPFYLKLLAWHALIRTEHTCTLAIMEKALTDLVCHFDHAFSRIVENLTYKQINFLKALVGGNQKPYSEATRQEYQLGTPGHVARIMASLERKELLYTGYGEINFIDPLFREWLHRRYFGSL
jgi:hypothetical protein